MAKLIESYDKQASSRVGNLHRSLCALRADKNAGTIKDAAEATLRLTEALGDLSEVLISMLDHIDGDTDLEDSHDREQYSHAGYEPEYGIDQRVPLVKCLPDGYDYT
ncbi:MAG: hypothetical protein CMN56_05275 [Sneathiella sp.]|uniref:hypothetical protein n=1 Tax=Sneathiella sp. TaxID=1964365 RepID=UPI000C35773A|nr:hypothetical protein [Sneathiella sp.]MAZ02531.1 hypothetical protein [Sneathiella sp.]